MKKIILSALLLCICAVATKAQYNSLDVTNTTSCDVFYILHGTTSGSGCQANYKSTLLHLGANSSVSYSDPSAVPGGLDDGNGNILGAGDDFTMALIYEGSQACISNPAAQMSDCIPGAATNVTGFTLEDAACMSCTSANIDWNVLSPSQVSVDVN